VYPSLIFEHDLALQERFLCQIDIEQSWKANQIRNNRINFEIINNNEVRYSGSKQIFPDTEKKVNPFQN
jgi:hypothetical protein